MPTLNDVLQSPLTKLVLASANPILAVVPEIAKIFMDKGTPVPERNVAAAVRLVETAQQALQKAGIDAPNAQAAAEAVTSNPQAREAVRAAVLSDPYWHSVEVGGGVVAAAARNDELISRHDWRALAYNPAVWFTAAILPLVYMTVGEVLRGSGWSGEIKASVVSAIVSGVLFGMTGYWLGTSASSQRKTDIMGGNSGSSSLPR